MKKIFIVLLALTICLGLCACNSNVVSSEEVPITLPAVPEPVTIPPQPSGTARENTEPTGETYPWEAEFQEEGYKKFNIGLADQNGDTGTGICWAKSTPMKPARQLNMYYNGDVEDTYWGYPDSDFPSHQIFYGADGSYLEQHFLNNGYYEEGTGIAYWGTTVYTKEIKADGSYWEYQNNEAGITLYSIYTEASGYYVATYYYEDGSIQNKTFNDPVTGDYQFEERTESGTLRKFVLSNSITGELNEQEFYDNGKPKYIKSQNKDFTQMARYDESGYCTYFYQKDAAGELELISDETGKLVSCLRNGEPMDDPALLERNAATYNFRRN